MKSPKDNIKNIEHNLDVDSTTERAHKSDDYLANRPEKSPLGVSYALKTPSVVQETQKEVAHDALSEQKSAKVDTANKHKNTKCLDSESETLHEIDCAQCPKEDAVSLTTVIAKNDTAKSSKDALESFTDNSNSVNSVEIARQNLYTRQDKQLTTTEKYRSRKKSNLTVASSTKGNSALGVEKLLIESRDKRQQDSQDTQSKAEYCKASRKVIPIDQAQEFSVNPEYGLSIDEVNIRLREGLDNVNRQKGGKSVMSIILSNLFTYFNMLYMVISAVLIYFGQAKQLTFLVVIVANTLIAIIQEIKSKRSLDRLKLISLPQIEVIRCGEKQSVPVEQLVLSDIVCLSSGSQIPADCVVLQGDIEVNESVLTGESDNISKTVGDTIFSGSYVVSNKCIAQVKAVGKYNFIESMSGKVKRYVKPKSQLFGSFKIILYVISILVIPLAVLIYMANKASAQSIADLVVNTATPIVNLIPAGPFLLTSVALAVSVIRLAKHKTMVKELYCIEMLARVDTLCLDKTGTLTDGSMRVVESMDLRTDSRILIKDIISTLVYCLGENNMTANCLRSFYGEKPHGALISTAVLPFSSERKFSAVSFKNQGTYFLGAPEFILTNRNQRVEELVTNYAKQGYRVLLLAHSASQMTVSKHRTQLPLIRGAAALIVIEDHIRPEAEQTLEWFAQLGVDIKLISGDNPITVSNIASRLGIADAYNAISLENMSDDKVRKYATEYTVFGRVSPEQKSILINQLKTQGRTVAMTGDGVNDILALREADCSIAMASGSDATRNVSHLVLLDNNFQSLPKVVGEGRRTVNNIQNAASMFFMKTVFTLVLLIAIVVLNLRFGRTDYIYPFKLTQLLLLETFIVGLPTVLLALQRNDSVIKGHFLKNTFSRALPASITFILAIGTIFLFNGFGGLPASKDAFYTVCALVYTMCGFYALVMACRPINFWKTALIIVTGFICVFAASFLPNVFDYASLNREEILLLLTVGFGALPVYCLLYFLFVSAGKKSNMRSIKND